MRKRCNCPLCGFEFSVNINGQGATRTCPGCGEKLSLEVLTGEHLAFDLLAFASHPVNKGGRVKYDQEGKCPLCNGQLDYGIQSNDALSACFEVSCKSCNWTGLEWCKIVYSKHIDEKENDLKIGDMTITQGK